MSESWQQLEGRIAEIQRELVLTATCGGSDLLEREEELLDELALLEQDSREGSSPVAGNNSIWEVNR